MDLVTWFFVCKDVPRLVMMKGCVRLKCCQNVPIGAFLTGLKHSDN